MTVIRVESISKRYRLGTIGRTALHEDLSRWWARLRGRPDPTLRLDELQRLELKRQAAADGGGALRDDAEHVWALRDVSFEVQQGEVLGIIGRNGAGKSTLLKILTRVTAPTLGTVKMKGRVASLLEVGTGFHPELTGRENIFLNGTILGMTRAEVRRKFDEIVAFAELDKFIDTPVKRYSSGMYVRLAFAVGDQAFQAKCLGKMGEVARGGRTVLFVSHNMGSIQRLCSRCVLLEHGTVARTGSPADVIPDYLSGTLSDRSRSVLTAASHRVISNLQIESVEVLDRHGRPAGVLSLDDAVSMRLEVGSGSAYAGVRVGVALGREGVVLSTFHSPPMDFAVGDRRAVVCRVPAGILLPGVYDLHVGAHIEGTKRGLDWVPDAHAFRILSLGGDEAAERAAREMGVVRLPSEWATQPEEQTHAR